VRGREEVGGGARVERKQKVRKKRASRNKRELESEAGGILERRWGWKR